MAISRYIYGGLSYYNVSVGRVAMLCIVASYGWPIAACLFVCLFVTVGILARAKNLTGLQRNKTLQPRGLSLGTCMEMVSSRLELVATCVCGRFCRITTTGRPYLRLLFGRSVGCCSFFLGFVLGCGLFFLFEVGISFFGEQVIP